MQCKKHQTNTVRLYLVLRWIKIRVARGSLKWGWAPRGHNNQQQQNHSLNFCSVNRFEVRHTIEPSREDLLAGSRFYNPRVSEKIVRVLLLVNYVYVTFAQGGPVCPTSYRTPRIKLLGDMSQNFGSTTISKSEQYSKYHQSSVFGGFNSFDGDSLPDYSEFDTDSATQEYFKERWAIASYESKCFFWFDLVSILCFCGVKRE